MRRWTGPLSGDPVPHGGDRGDDRGAGLARRRGSDATSGPGVAPAGWTAEVAGRPQAGGRGCRGVTAQLALSPAKAAPGPRVALSGPPPAPPRGTARTPPARTPPARTPPGQCPP